jgi:hypothetical protein
MKKMEEFIERKILFAEPISKIENYIEGFKLKGKNAMAAFSTTALKLFPDKKIEDVPMKIYVIRDNLENLYSSIRQKLINELINIKK